MEQNECFSLAYDRLGFTTNKMVWFKIVRVPGKDHQSFSFGTKLSDEVFRYAKNFKYSHEDVKEIVEYARVRGIRAKLKHSQCSDLHTVLRSRNRSPFFVTVDRTSFADNFQSCWKSYLSSIHLVTVYLGTDWWKVQFIIFLVLRKSVLGENTWKLITVSECVPEAHKEGQIPEGIIDPTHENNYKVMNDLLKGKDTRTIFSTISTGSFKTYFRNIGIIYWWICTFGWWWSSACLIVCLGQVLSVAISCNLLQSIISQNE